MFILLLLIAQIQDTKTSTIDKILSTAMMKNYKEAIWLLQNEQGQDPYQFGMDLAQKAGRPRAAVTWFQGLLNEVGEEENFRLACHGPVGWMQITKAP